MALGKQRRALGVLVLITWLGLVARPTRGDPSAVEGPASLGQQPLVTPPLDPTAAQFTSTQLNQLFQFQTTPNICAAGQAYVTAGVSYFSNFPNAAGYTPSRTGRPGDQVRPVIQGQYGITDQIAVGGYLPGVINTSGGGQSGPGDAGAYAQYKFDRMVDPRAIGLTAQLDLVLPTGDYGQFRDNGQVAGRVSGLVYKDFGPVGPGSPGVYGLLGYTGSDRCDLRLGLAGQYAVGPVVGVLELFGVHGFGHARSVGFVTPGVVYRGVDHFEFAVGVPIGISNTSPDWGVQVKVTYAFGN